MKASIVLVFFVLINTSLFAADYYISNAGNDANNGTSSATPWQTLTKLSAALGGSSGTWGTISTGDRVFFRRGDVFRGSIAFSAYNNDGITFDTYGSGALPIVKGSTLVTGWTVHSGNIWKATISQRVYFLYQNSVLKTLARAPNTGTWNASTATTTSMTSSSVSGSGQNFVGANVCIREYDWRLNRQVVTAQSSNTISWASAIEAAPAVNANFYFDNKLSLLDTAGEWFWDAATNTLYYMTDGTNPNTLTMEASVNLLGVAGNDNRSNNTIQNIQFTHFAQESIRLMGSANGNMVQNCVFNDNFQAMFVSGGSNTIQNNTITNSYYQGAVLANMQNSTFSNNTITNAGMTYGQHRPNFSGNFYSGGVWLINGNSGAVVSNNTITNIGNMGIRFNGTGVIIERNQVTNAMVNMDDGGGIYTWGGNNSSHGNTIRNNIVSTLVGNHNGSTPGSVINGIYIDNDAYSITVENNTVKNIPDGAGIIINAGAHDCPITGNVTYKCKQGLGFYDWRDGQSIYSNTMTGNTFYANITGAIPVEIASNDNNYTVLTTANNNFLCNPYGTSVARYIWSNAQTFTLAQWRTATGLDATSVGSYHNWTSPTDNSFLVTNNSSLAVMYNYANVAGLNNQTVISLTLQPFTSRVLINLTVLPVELRHFWGYAACNDIPHCFGKTAQNVLKWQTAEEKNVRHFDIERLAGGAVFEKIGEIKAEGAHSNYQFSDLNPIAPLHYYRLKTNDLDGKSVVSKIISIERKSKTVVKIYPSVTSGFLIIEQAKSFEIINSFGQIVEKKGFENFENTLNLSALPSGVYFVKGVDTKGTFFSEKIVKQ